MMQQYSIKCSEDIEKSDAVFISHLHYGIGLWQKKISKIDTTCAITKKMIGKKKICYVPCSFYPYSRDRISIDGLRILKTKFKRKERYQAEKGRQKIPSLVAL